MSPERVAEIYQESYADLVRGLRIATRSKPWSDVEDAVQFAFLKLLDEPAEIQHPLNWLFTAGYRFALRSYRYHFRHPEYLSDGQATIEHTTEPAPDVLEQLMQQERVLWLYREIAKLTPRQQQAIHTLLRSGRRAYGSGHISRAECAAREKAMRNLRRAARLVAA